MVSLIYFCYSSSKLSEIKEKKKSEVLTIVNRSDKLCRVFDTLGAGLTSGSMTLTSPLGDVSSALTIVASPLC